MASGAENSECVVQSAGCGRAEQWSSAWSAHAQPCDIRGAQRRAFINRRTLRGRPGYTRLGPLASSSSTECHWSLGFALAARLVPQQASPSNRSEEPASLPKHASSPCARQRRETRPQPLRTTARASFDIDSLASTSRDCGRGRAHEASREQRRREGVRRGARSLENSQPATLTAGLDAIGCGIPLLTPSQGPRRPSASGLTTAVTPAAVPAHSPVVSRPGIAP